MTADIGVQVPDSLSAIRDFLRNLPQPHSAAMETARKRQRQLTKPAGSLGRLESLAIWLAGWQGHSPTVDFPRALVFAGNHGIAERGISAFPAAVTAQMVANFAAGGAAVNQLCRAFEIELEVIALDLDQPTADFTRTPAMSETELMTAFGAGWRAVRPGTDVLMLGEMGIGNTTAASALAAALFGGTGRDWVGPGTGVDEAGLRRKAETVDLAIVRHGAALRDPLEALRRVGGREFGAIAGAVAAARARGIPVVLDGFVATAAAAVLHVASAGALAHTVVGHLSAEPAHRRLLDALGQTALLDLGMRLGEASGATLAFAVLQGAVATHSGMATFGEARISGKL